MFSSFQLRKTSVLLSREAQHAHSVHTGGSVAAGGFCPAGGRWGRSTGDGEQGLSCPGNASVRLVPLLGVESNVSSEPSQVIVERAGESSV